MHKSNQLSIVILGLSLSSSWGNGHATTYRALVKGLRELGHHVLFLERDTPWYSAHRDLPDPDYCTLDYYRNLAELEAYAPVVAAADLVIVGSYVPEGEAVIDWVTRLRSDLCFYDIDTPVTLAGLEDGSCHYLRRDQVSSFTTYFSFAGGKALDILQRRFGARDARALYCSVDAGSYFPTGEEKRWDLGYLGTYSPDRQPTLDELLIEPARRLPELRFVVAGPQYPADIDWPANVERIEHVAPADHASFYSRQRYTLNVTRSDMVRCGWSPSVRLFEAAACATPIVSDRWEGLTRIFDGDTISIADGAEDVVRLLRRHDEARRHRQAAAARDLVLARHSGLARARELLAATIDMTNANFNNEDRIVA
ncbi:MAG: glycosyltransferase [Rhizobiaceae bacterium]|nr:glycosyltransferase [Rhizobiaceae bacterium]MCV0407471.1 glycosyltransferase [Rhizobiaceae bacterium]